MRRQKNVLLVLMLMMVVCMVNITVAYAYGLSDDKSDYQRQGYTCTETYHEYQDDAGFAAFRALRIGKFLHSIATGQGQSECSNFEYLARPAFGYVKYTHKGGVGSTTLWHVAEPCWTDKFGSLFNSVKSVEVRGKLVSDDGCYESLTNWVTDKDS